jgi:CRP/FNR family cyclic AMP-dependent transcriptional regulator
VVPTPEKFTERFPSFAAHSSREDIEAFLKALQRREIPAGEILIQDGEVSDSLYFLWEGFLRAYLEHNGEVVSLGRISPGQWVGEVSMLDPGPATASVKAESNSTLLVLSRDTFEALDRENPVLTGRLLRSLSGLLISRLRSSSELLFSAFAQPPGSSANKEDRVRDTFKRIYRRLLGSAEVVE